MRFKTLTMAFALKLNLIKPIALAVSLAALGGYTGTASAQPTGYEPPSPTVCRDTRWIAQNAGQPLGKGLQEMLAVCANIPDPAPPASVANAPAPSPPRQPMTEYEAQLIQLQQQQLDMQRRAQTSQALMNMMALQQDMFRANADRQAAIAQHQLDGIYSLGRPPVYVCPYFGCR